MFSSVFFTVYNSWKARVFHGVPVSMLGAVVLRTCFMVREISRMQDRIKVCSFIVEWKIWCSI